MQVQCRPRVWTKLKNGNKNYGKIKKKRLNINSQPKIYFYCEVCCRARHTGAREVGVGSTPSRRNAEKLSLKNAIKSSDAANLTLANTLLMNLFGVRNYCCHFDLNIKIKKLSAHIQKMSFKMSKFLFWIDLLMFTVKQYTWVCLSTCTKMLLLL